MGEHQGLVGDGSPAGARNVEAEGRFAIGKVITQGVRE